MCAHIVDKLDDIELRRNYITSVKLHSITNILIMKIKWKKQPPKAK